MRDKVTRPKIFNRAEAESNRGPSAYKSNILLQGQTVQFFTQSNYLVTNNEIYWP